MGKLSDLKIKSAKPGKHSDGDGMYLLVTVSGGKLWRYDYRFTGKRKTLSMGAYPEISLADARELVAKARKQLASGVDPSAAKLKAKQAVLEAHEATFKAVALLWQATTATKRKANTEAKLSNWLVNDVYPLIGSIPVSQLNAPDVMRVLRRLEARGVTDTVKRVKQIISRVMSFAVTDGLAQDNPTAHIKNRDSFEQKVAKHHAAIVEPVAFGGLLRSIRGYTGHATSCNALQLSPLLFVRPGELRHAEWSEIDLDKGVWSIPATKMKMKVEHTVPLSRQAVVILRQQQAISGHGAYVFPSIRGDGRPMSENTINAALRGLGVDADTHSAHGFRASARTMLDELLSVRVEVVEMQLAHKVKDANGNAYNRTTFWAERVEMMQRWADYCDRLEHGGEVLAFAAKAA